MVQLEALEKTIGQQQRDLKNLNEQNHQQLEAFNQTKQDLQTKLDKVWSLGNLKEHTLLILKATYSGV
jgi:hypothetical protein